MGLFVIHVLNTVAARISSTLENNLKTRERALDNRLHFRQEDNM
jgi:hypothetical protein